MNNIKYFIVKSKVSSGTSSDITYGIAAHDTASPKNVIAYIRDITPDKKSLERFVDLCNREDLSPVHLNDAVEDFLCR